MTQQSKKLLGLAMLLVSITLLLTFPHGADAQRLFPRIAPTCDQDVVMVNGAPNIPVGERCGLNDLVQLFINLFDWGLAILSIISIVFLIIGGAYLLVSAGNEQRVQTGKSILVNTTLGIGIALGSWLVINTVIGLLVGNGTFDNVQVFAKNWWGANTCTNEYSTLCAQYDLREGCGDVRTSYVSELQRKLRDAECGNIEPDGCFGPQTSLAVQAFNQAYGFEPESVAHRNTWDKLNSGAKCTAGAIPQQVAAGNGCCVTQCGTGQANTAENNGATGCKDLYPGTASVWYIGACTTDAITTPSGCCQLPGNNTCISQANVDWCKKTITNSQPGIYATGACDATRCPAGISNACL